MEKTSFLLISLFLLVPGLVNAALVPCDVCRDFSDIAQMVKNIANLILLEIVPALAILMLTIGGLMLLFSGGNPNMVSMGKKTLLAAVIGIALSLGAAAIINLFLNALGYKYGGV